MKGEKTENLLNNQFIYGGFGAICNVDVQNQSPGMDPKFTLKVVQNESLSLLYSYRKKEGLILTGSAGGVLEENIIGKILAIPECDLDKHLEFTENFGFFYKIKTEEYSSIDVNDYLAIFYRIKSTIRLINAIGKCDYKSILTNVSYLLFSPQIKFDVGDKSYTSARHRFGELVLNYNNFPDFNNDKTVVTSRKIAVSDTIKGEYEVDFDFYQAVKSSSDMTLLGSNTVWYKRLMAMYLGCLDENVELREIIDFYFHFQNTVSVISDIKFNSITFIDESISNYPLDDDLKKALLKVARIVLRDEINYNIKNIHPKYEGTKLTPSWQIDNFIEAIYFSVFYMKPGVEMYKECENPNCKRDRYFLVETTRGNKKYCCQQCATAAAAQRHRQKQKKNTIQG